MNKTVRQVVLNMLCTRGYIIPDINDFLKMEEYLTHKKTDENDKIFVFFPETPKVGITTIRQYVKEMEDLKVQTSIIIVKESITAFAKQVFTEIKPLIIDYFTEDELKIDKTQHCLVPKHELLTEEQKKELLKMYKCKESQLPKISSYDPISRYFGAKRGQVFKIIRISETSGEYIYYRLVV